MFLIHRYPHLAITLLFSILSVPIQAAEDHYLWLEKVDSPAALSWVKAQNAKTVSLLQGDTRYRGIESEIKKIVFAPDRLVTPTLNGGWIYQFWKDQRHVKGIWRRTSPSEYPKPMPRWEMLLDLDALAKAERENWVWEGASCLPPDYLRCLLYLSRGGKDASVVREFEISQRAFVPKGFSLPEAKSQVAWLDQNTLLVGTDFGPGSLTDSSYPRVVKRWKRGTSLSQATLVFEGKARDVSDSAFVSHRPEGTLAFVVRGKSFFESEYYWLDRPSHRTKVPLPVDADIKAVYKGFLIALLRSDWKTPTRRFPEGALVAFPLTASESKSPELSVEVVFLPDSHTALTATATTKQSLYLSVLEDVKGRLLRVRRGSKGWRVEKVPLPDNGTVSVLSTDDYEDRLIVDYESFLVPSTLYLVTDSAAAPKLSVLTRLPERFDASRLLVEQLLATSKDGTKVPYFVIHKKGMALTGQTPTLLYAYGGFEVSETPFYLSTTGKVWAEKGYAFALANIRGGGEFGPHWHKAALTGHRQRAFDDFESVSQDLIQRGITSPRRLGIRGGSNGGLLMGVAFTQRPDLYRAVLCEVPLLDMMRYTHLLAGSSWIEEYGDPDDPRMAAVIRKYSPYQNVQPGIHYPRVFFYTATSDDRVGPMHARKMVAKMEAQGHPVLFFENTDGGHGGAATLQQIVTRSALEFSYLFRRLVD